MPAPPEGAGQDGMNIAEYLFTAAPFPEPLNTQGGRMNDRAQFDDPNLESLLPRVAFTRRGFIASSLASGFALAAGPVVAQTAIITPADGLDVGAAQVPVSGGGNLPVYFAS